MTAAAPIALLVGAFLYAEIMFFSSKFSIIFYNIYREGTWCIDMSKYTED